MSISSVKAVVLRVQTSSETYYLCNRHGVTLDNEIYLPLLVNVGNVEKIGNFGEGHQVGSCAVTLLHGNSQHQGSYVMNTTFIWNNGVCEIKLCDVGTDTTWAACENYAKGLVKNFNVQDGIISFTVDDINTRDNVILPLKTVSDYTGEQSLPASGIIDGYSSKRIPIQFGNLNDGSSGAFAKCILVNKNVGYQRVIADTASLVSMENIGIWENGSKRFFEGRKYSGGLEPGKSYSFGEYTIASSANRADFLVDTTTTLVTALTASEGIELITIGNYSKLAWIDEEEEERWQDYPEILSINIIAIDSELLLIVDKPKSNDVWVERGYAGSSVEEHSVGAQVFQCAKFSARNLLSFTERFIPEHISNQFYAKDTRFTQSTSVANCTLATPDELISEGKWSNIVDGDPSTFIKFDYTLVITANEDYVYYLGAWINFDARFPRIDSDLTVFGTFPCVKCSLSASLESGSINYSSLLRLRSVIRAREADTTDSYFTAPTPTESGSRWFYADLQAKDAGSGFSWSGSVDYYDILERRQYSWSTGRNILYFNEISPSDYLIGIRTLNDLNKRIKFGVGFDAYSDQGLAPNNADATVDFSCTLYGIGIWVDFFCDMTSVVLCSELVGRETITPVSSITGSDQVTNSNPVSVIADLLVVEMGYAETDFDTTEWQAVWTYFQTSAAFGGDDIPELAMSYGISESDEGWQLCEKIAQQFNLSLVKKDDGKIGILNLHKLQSTDETYGYPSMTHYGISIDDVLFDGGRRRISIQQTGTDRLRNDVAIKYSRNNSTDQYKSVYPASDDSPETYVLPVPNVTLAVAKNTYYGGKSTEQLSIDAFAIYNETDAERLWKWHINDKAVSSLWAEFTIDYNHYSDVNSKSSQYERGDIIYLDGQLDDKSFSSTRPFVIRDIIKKDNGRELEIHAKSIHPAASFTSTAEGQGDTYQNTVDDTDIWQNTVNSSTIYQNRT